MVEPEPEVASEPHVRLRLDLAYDGAAFVGWAKQPALRSVQGTLEDALGMVLRLDGPAALTVAGRTDSGVHARGQVAHLDVPVAAFEAVVGRSDLAPAEALVRRLAGVLPSDVVVHRTREAPPGFDARFSAIWRRYSYTVLDGATRRDPLTRGTRWWLRHDLDLDAMNAAAQHLVGEHDFLAYCKPREGATTIRTLLELSWTRESDGALVATVRADAFCHSMVRALMGAIIAVGQGSWPREKPRDLLDAVERNTGIQVAPAHPLVLEEVGYPPDADLAARATAARSMRTRATPPVPLPAAD